MDENSRSAKVDRSDFAILTHGLDCECKHFVGEGFCRNTYLGSFDFEVSGNREGREVELGYFDIDSNSGTSNSGNSFFNFLHSLMYMMHLQRIDHLDA